MGLLKLARLLTVRLDRPLNKFPFLLFPFERTAIDELSTGYLFIVCIISMKANKRKIL